MAWTPHHSQSVQSSATFEEVWDTAELNALLHVRAALLSIVALNSHICHDLHQATSYLDIMGAADVNAHSCKHLRTPALLGTRYQYAALWARLVLASISRNSTDAWSLRTWLHEIEVSTRMQLEVLMSRHLLMSSFRERSRKLFDELGFPSNEHMSPTL